MRKNKKTLSQRVKPWMTAVFLVLFLVLAAPFPVFGDSETGILRETAPEDEHYRLIPGVVLKASAKLDLWHYSGGYWKVTNEGSQAIRVSDDEMGRGDNLVIPSADANFTVKLPPAVKELLASGKTVIPVIRADSGVELSELFETRGRTFRMDGDTLTFSARPRFNLIPTREVSFKRNYGLDIPVTVPFIQRKYGYNMYSVFGNGYRAVQVNGFVDPGNPSSLSGTPSGWIHPSMVADTSGTIKPGYQLMINSRLMPSQGFSIGQGTFQDAGALGLCFEYPVSFTFYVYDEEYVPEPEPPEKPDPEEPEEPEKILCGRCEKCQLSKTGVCAEDTCPDFNTERCGCYEPPEIRAEAVLALPDHTYETHPVTAVDRSIFFIEGVQYGSIRAYEEGYARNRFDIVEEGTGGTVTRVKNSRTEAEVSFPKKGDYHVQLKVSPSTGGSLYDTKPIEVIKTPTVLAELAGTQKQNRKQILNIRVATHAEYPLSDLHVEIVHKETGEGVRLNHRMDGGQNRLENTDLIKTRPIAGLKSDQYWTNCRLEFLTKNETEEDFLFRVYARDKRGLWDRLEQEFTVAPDLPPEALIEVAPSFLRKEGENTAVISAEDGSTTDGDQLQRKWSVADSRLYNGDYDVFVSPPAVDLFEGVEFTDVGKKPGYRDNSFGTGKSVQFERVGVGKLRLKLDVKEVWTEETLPEYITEDDYLTASATADTEVINVAPVVSLEPIRPRTAELLLLAGGDEEYRQLKQTAAEINGALLENAVDARISVEKMSPEKDASITYAVKSEAIANYGFQGTWAGFWESGSCIVDDYRLYKAEATWVQGTRDIDDYPELPFTIRAYDAREEGRPAPEWSCTITRDLIGAEDRGYQAYFAQDLDCKYLYFCMAEKTVVIDKNTGAILTVLPFSMGRSNSVWDNNIYTYRGDGIWRISMTDGTIRQIRSMQIASGAARRIGGKDHLMTKNGTAINRAVFDPRTENLRLERLLGTEGDDGRTTYRLAGIDAEGKVIVSCVAPASGNAALKIRVYDRDNALLKTIAHSLYKADQDYVTPVYDAGGICRYVGLSKEAGNSSYKRVTVNVQGIYDDYSGTAAAENRASVGYPTCAGRILMGVEHGDGNVYIMTAGIYNYIADQGYNSALHGMPERARAFRFDVKNGGASECENLAGGVFSGIGREAEYAVASDAYIAVSTGDNNQYEGANHTTKLVRWGQSPEKVLKRYINRNLSSDKDISAVIVLDRSGRKGTEDAATAAACLKEKKARLLFAGAEEGQGYGSALVAACDSSGRLVTGEPGQLAESILSILLKEEGKEGLLQLKTTEARGGIQRSYQLTPGLRYFYEYEYRRFDAQGGSGPETEADKTGWKGTGTGGAGDILRLTAEYERPVPEKELLKDRYVVTQSFEEDFNDLRTNPYFNLQAGRIREGQYFGAYGEGKTSSNRYHRDGSALTFAVPEGKQAVVSWDYELQRQEAVDWNMGYYVDGSLWKQFVASSTAAGHYTHPDLLEPGEHSIAFKCGSYGKSYAFWAKMDNLKVHFVELNPETSVQDDGDINGKTDDNPEAGAALDAVGDRVEASSSVSGGEWIRVQGSFVAPDSVAAFQAIPAVYHYDDLSADSGPYHTWKSKEKGNQSITFDPKGKAAYFAPSFSIRYDKAVNLRLGAYTFRGRTPKEDKDEMNNISGNFIMALRNTSQPLSGTVTHGTYNTMTNGRFTGLEVVKAEKESGFRMAAANRFFIAPGGDGTKEMFVESDAFSGKVGFRFSPGEKGDWLLRNLRIYSIQNGVRVYTEDCAMAESGQTAKWKTEDAQTAVVSMDKSEDKEEKKLIYRKGELVTHGVHYYDYEGDPSKKQYWSYDHTPFNDGPHPQAATILDDGGRAVSMPGIVLDRPIDRFYIDGKYTVRHWQEDNTTRGKEESGNPDYDKTSNTAALTFYVQGDGAAPWISYIKTEPHTVKEGDRFRLRIGVDDLEKDPLNLTAEVYYEGKLITAFRKEGVEADAATRQYPEILTDFLPGKAQTGKYQVVCTVRDWSGAGIGSYEFTVVTEGRILGMVMHTEQWDKNRKQYNRSRFREEYNEVCEFDGYKKKKAPRKRGINVFWSGEEFVLRAAVQGKPDSVTCRILGESYSSILKKTGETDEAGNSIYSGTLWNAGMVGRWGKTSPELLTFRFTATYPGDNKKTDDAQVILDDWESYWQLHRLH